MEVIEVPRAAPNTAYQVKGIKGHHYGLTFYLAGDDTNCKLSYIHALGNLGAVKDKKEKKEVIDSLLKFCKGMVILNTTNKSEADFIKETYDTYYYHKVPVGYNNGYQYHIAIRNPISINANCRKPEKNTDLLEPIDKNSIKDKLLIILKSKRRKSDFVDEFIASL